MEFTISPPAPIPKRSKRSAKGLPPDNDVEQPAEKPVLILKPFSTVPHVSFNHVKLGSSKTLHLYLNNPLDTGQVVKVEKFPNEKGFFIENDEFFIEPLEEKAVQILWVPAKPANYRETIVFKSSSGCKFSAYLHGIANLPAKKKITASKNVPKIPIIPQHVKKREPCSENILKFEDKKENFNSLNSKCPPFPNDFESLSFKFPSVTEPRPSFTLKTGEEFSDSPIRRQTYTINSMLSNGRESEILPVPPGKSFYAPKIEIYQEQLMSDKFSSKILSETDIPIGECDLNDSLESTNLKGDVVNDSIGNRNRNTWENAQGLISNSSMFSLKKDSERNNPYSVSKLLSSKNNLDVEHTELKCNKYPDGLGFETDISINPEKEIEVFDRSTKRLFFGYTPKNVKRRRWSNVINNFAEIPEDSFDGKSYGIDELPSTLLAANNVDNNFTEIPEDSFDGKSYDIDELPSTFLAANNVNASDSNVFKYDVSFENYTHEFRRTDVKVFESSNELPLQKVFAPLESFPLEQQNIDCFSKNEEKEAVSEKLKKLWSAEFLANASAASNSSSLSDFSIKAQKRATFNVPAKKSVKNRQKLSPFKAGVMKSKMSSAKQEAFSKNVSKTSSSAIGPHVQKLKNCMPQKLSLKKPKVSEPVTYLRNPFASMNIYYDERWIEKREAAFTAWLNFMLTPNDDLSSEDIKVDSAKLWIESIKENSAVPAPTKEELSFKAFTATRNLNALRKSAFSLYHSAEVVAVIEKIEKEVDVKKLSIRKDRATHADLGIKKHILEMLLSYNTLWLRIGLETVYGEIINLQNNSDVLGLSRFIIHRFLHSPEISSKYSHQAVINYYKKGFEEKMKCFILKKFLLLIYFLDKAKTVHLIKHKPCLFNKNSKYKSSRDMLLVFSREYLSGEGDITKHLRYLGYTVSYQQSALDEFDFSVRNISVDLRCGLRLGRVVELLLEDWTIFQKLRINTLNRLTKIHNNDVILQSLKNASIEIENNIDAKDITDGDREKTLDLLWQIIFKTQIKKLINKDFLKKENAFLSRSLQLKVDYAAYNALRKPDYSFDRPEVSIFNSDLYKENEVLQLLFQWCRNVCALYNVKVHNFTSSFSDGRALCVLLHHYHPNILPYNAIKFETTSSYFEKQMEIAESNDSSAFFTPNDGSSLLADNDKANLTLVFKKFQEVGHIPILSRPTDMSYMPDEKVVVTLISYINIRLMELSIEIRAARKILHAWRCYKLRIQQKKLMDEIKAVKTIARAWKNYLERKRLKEKIKSAIKIQSYWRMYSAKRCLRNLKNQKKMEELNRSATTIQASFRGFSVRKQILRHHQAAVIIQASIRQWLVRSQYIKLRDATVKIQQKYRAKLKGQSQRRQFIAVRHNVIKLQACARGMLIRNRIKKQICSVLKLQAYVRMWLMKKRYSKIKNACITIQQRFRGHLLTKRLHEEHQNQRAAAIIIQKWYRIIKTKEYEMKCAVKIQSYVRTYIARKKFLNLQRNIIQIQAWWRAVSAGRKARLQYTQTYRNIVSIQSVVRMYIARKKYNQQKRSAIVIQKYFRTYSAKSKFEKLKQNVKLIQNLWRAKVLSRKTRSEYVQFRNNVIVMQSAVRCFIAVRNFKKQRHAAIVIQKNIRAFIQRQKFCDFKRSVMLIQRRWREVILTRQTRISFLLYRQKVIYLQSVVRQKIAYNSLKQKKQAAIVIQRYVRMFFKRKLYLKLKHSVNVIQNWWRSILLGRRERNNFMNYRKAAVSIQAMYRMHLCKKRLALLRKSVATIERYRIVKIQKINYLNMKLSAIRIQSIFRCYLFRKQYLKTRKDIVLAQACCRRFILRNKFVRMKSSAVKIQNYYRAYKLTCTERKNYLQIRNAVIKLQAAYRGNVVRKNLNDMHKKATVIQSCYRRWKMQSKYVNLKKNCIFIQRKYRAKVEMRKHYQQFIHTKTAVIKIQAFVRCYIVRTKYKQMRSAAIKIQSYFRMVKYYRRYAKIKNATKVIQRYYRSFKNMKAVQNYYRRKRLLVILLQSKVRSLITRKRFLEKKRACILMQSMVRMHIQRKKYVKVVESTICLQKYYRNFITMKVQRSLFLECKQKVICLQSHVRSMIARRYFLKQKKACILIQSAARMYIQRKRYVKYLNAVIFIQRHYRSLLLMKAQKNIYLQKRKSIIYIQSQVRSVIARRRFLKKKSACVSIQSFTRMCLQRKRYAKICKAAVVVQKWFRNQQVMRKFRNAYLEKRNSVIYLQSVTRMYLARKKFLETRRTIICVQRHYRSLMLMKTQRDAYLQLRKSVIFLQSHIRSVNARKRYLQQRRACIILQSAVRMYIQRKKYVKICNAAMILQRHFRNHQIMKKDRNAFVRKRKAVIYLQSKVCSMIARKAFLKQKNACIRIQSFVRMYQQRKKYKNTRRAVVCLQAYYRSWKLMKTERKNYLLKRHATIVLQSRWRSVLSRKYFLKQKKSAVVIQSYVRMYSCRNRFLSQKSAVVSIQKHYRSWKVMKLQQGAYIQKRKAAVLLQSRFRSLLVRRDFVKKKDACIVIQSFFKMHLQRARYRKILSTAIFLQRLYRSKCFTKMYRSAFVEKRNAAVLLQSKFRSVQARTKYVKLKQACVVIQSFVRMCIIRIRYKKILKATTMIQDCFRRYEIAKKARNNYLLMQKASVTIQSYFRMHKCRKEFLLLCSTVSFIQSKYRAKLEAKRTRLRFLKQKSACIKIQSYFRMICAIKKLSQYRKACITIQANYRSYVARKKYKLYMSDRMYNLSCTKIQALWRGYALRKKLKTQVEAAVNIQRAFRLWHQKKICKNMTSLIQNKSNLSQALFQRLWYLSLKKSVISFQRAARHYILKRHLAAITIQSYFKMWCAQQHYKKMKAALMIQSCWRGYCVRRCIKDKKILDAKRRIKAADSSEANRLKNRTTRSLAVLFKDTNVQSILIALEDLDACTKLSPKVCERLVESGGLSILIQLINLCNRSVPHMEIIKLVTYILLNLAKYHKTVDYVWKEQGSLDVIIHMMKIFREKCIPIFTKCCSLIWIFCQDPAKVEDMKKNTSFTEQIRSFHFLITRKQSLEERRQVARAIASKTFNPRLLSKKPNLERQRLQIDPDWSLGNNKRRDFKDPIIVLTWIMKCLDLKSK